MSLDRRRVLLAACALLSPLLILPLGCKGRGFGRTAPRAPIVLITIDALRADVVGALGGPPKLMPALDGLVREAAWAGRAVSPSSWTVPSMGSIFTGYQPFRVRNWSGDQARLADRLVTLPESLKKAGYRTAGFRSNHWLQEEFGYSQGFDTFKYLREGRRAEGYLRQLRPDSDFVWVHILPPHAPYVRHDPLVARLDEVPPDLPQRVTPLDLEPYYDPAVDLPADRERVFRAMYQLNAAWADQMLGRMLAALRASGQYDRALIVVTSDHGEELGEYGQIAHGGNLGQVLVEVPLVIKLPAGFAGKLRIPAGRAVSNLRVAATLIEAAGGEPEPGAAKSLFRPLDERDRGALSELYLGNGVNRFSLVEGDLQLLWESRFSPPDGDYFRARLAGIGGHPNPPLAEPPAAVFNRLHEAFAQVLPLTGLPGSPPQLTLWRWSAKGSERVEDPQQVQRMARQLRSAWLAANGAEVVPGRSTGQPRLTKAQEEELKALGYIAGGN